MRERAGDRLPKFSEAEKGLVKGSLDFVGINHYTTYYASNMPIVQIFLNDSESDSQSLTIRKSSPRRCHLLLLLLLLLPVFSYFLPLNLGSLLN